MNLWRVGVDQATGEPLGEPEPLTAPSKWVSGISISGDGTLIAYADDASSTNVSKVQFDPETSEIVGEPIAITQGSDDVVQPRVSPDGNWVVFRTAGKQEDIFVIGADGTDLRQLTDDPAKDRGPSWSPDGESIVFYSDRSGRYELWVIRFDGSGLQQLTQIDGDSYWYPVWSPDGRWVAGTNNTDTSLWDVTGSWPVTGRKTLPPVDESGRSIYYPRWSRDGEELAGVLVESSSTRGRGWVVYSLATGEFKTIYLAEPDQQTFPVDWLSDGTRIIGLIGQADGSQRLVTVDVETLDVVEVAQFSRGTLVYSISADDRELFYEVTDERSDLWLATLE